MSDKNGSGAEDSTTSTSNKRRRDRSSSPDSPESLLEDKIKRLQRELTKSIFDAGHWKLLYEQKTSEHNVLDEELTSLKSRHARQARISQLNSSEAELRKRDNQLEKANNEISRLDGENDAIQNQLQALTNEKEQFDVLRDDLNQTIVTLREELTNARQQLILVGDWAANVGAVSDLIKASTLHLKDPTSTLKDLNLFRLPDPEPGKGDNDYAPDAGATVAKSIPVDDDDPADNPAVNLDPAPTPSKSPPAPTPTQEPETDFGLGEDATFGESANLNSLGAGYGTHSDMDSPEMRSLDFTFRPTPPSPSPVPLPAPASSPSANTEEKATPVWDTMFTISTEAMACLEANGGTTCIADADSKSTRSIFSMTDKNGVHMLAHRLTEGVMGLKTSFEGSIVKKIVPYQAGQVKAKKSSKTKVATEPDIERMKVNAYATKLNIPGKCLPCWYSVAQGREDSPAKRVYHNTACTTNLGGKTRIIWVNAYRLSAEELFNGGCKNCFHLWLAQLILEWSPLATTVTSIVSMDRVATWYHYFDVYELWASEPKDYREWYTNKDVKGTLSYPFDLQTPVKNGVCEPLSVKNAIGQLLASRNSRDQRVKKTPSKKETATRSGSSTESNEDTGSSTSYLGHSWVMTRGVISTETIPIPKIKKVPGSSTYDRPAASLRLAMPSNRMTAYAMEYVRPELRSLGRIHDFDIPVDVPYWIVKTDTEKATDFAPHEFLKRETWGPAQWNISVTMPRQTTADFMPTEWSWFREDTKSLIFFSWDSFPFEYDIDVPNGPQVPILHFTRFLTPKSMRGFKRFPLGILWQLDDWGFTHPPVPSPLNVRNTMGHASVGIRRDRTDDLGPETVRGYERVPGWGDDVQRCILKGEENTHWILLDRTAEIWYTRPWSTFPFEFPYKYDKTGRVHGGPCVAAVSQHQAVKSTGFPDAVMTNPKTCEVYEVYRQQTALRDVSKDRSIARLPAGEPGCSFNSATAADLPPPPEVPTNSPAASPARDA